MQHTPGDRDHLVGRHGAHRGASGRVDLAEIDVEAHEIAALARDEHDVAPVARLDCGLDPNVGEVGDGKDVHHAPGMVGEITAQLAPDRLAHGTASAVAADDVPGADNDLLALACGISAPQCDGDGMVVALVDGEAGELEAVIDLEPARRAPHRLQQVVMDPRLVDDHVRELRQAVLHVLHASGAHDPRPIVLVGPPEHGLIHPIGLSDQVLTESERLEHLHRAAGDAVGLPELDRTRPALHDACRDPRELRQLSGQHQPGGTGAHDEHVDLGGQFGRSGSRNRISRPDSRVTDLEAVQVELHARATLLPAWLLSRRWTDG